MRREPHESNGVSGKKFLYNGPRQRGSAFEDEDDGITFPTTWQTDNTAKFKPLGDDIEETWNIRKNITAKAPADSVNANDGYYFNIGKGYYSRHGGLAETSAKESTDSHITGGSWNQKKSFSYGQSVSNSGGATPGGPQQTPGTNRMPTSRHF